MTLWNPGTIKGVTFHNAKLQLGMDGITLATLRNALIKTVQEHTLEPHFYPEMSEADRDEAIAYADKYSANVNWDEMEIVDYKPLDELTGDSNFDLIGAAADSETPVRISIGGMIYTVEKGVGGLRIVHPTQTIFIHGGKSGMSEKIVADAIRESGFVNPDPYVGLIEVEYSTRGYRAGYGIRRSGECSCWYD